METLRELGDKYGTDKVAHRFVDHYERRLEENRQTITTVLEIGIMGGASLRMWRDYFPNAMIHGVDVCKDTLFTEERIRCHKGKQEDVAFLESVISETGDFDVIVDDGGHRGIQHVASFNALWPHVKPGGWYFIEDAFSIYNFCWTRPGEYTMIDLLNSKWELILKGHADIAEVCVIGDGCNDGLIGLRKRDTLPLDEFATEGYQRHNLCRQNHLASLELDLTNKAVLELGAGVGDHTDFFLQRGCVVTCAEAREDNLAQLRGKHNTSRTLTIDLDDPESLPRDEVYDVVYAYGILYHLGRPAEALSTWAAVTDGVLLLETCVSSDPGVGIHFAQEDASNATASYTGGSCRPSREWVLAELRKHFPFVYLPTTQPDHEEFPLDWSNVPEEGNHRAVFIASKTQLDNHWLILNALPPVQTPYKVQKNAPA